LTPDGKLAGWVTPDGGTPTFSYDPAGRLWKQTDASGNVTTEYGYDFGNLKSVEDPTGGVTTMTYDVVNRLKERTLPHGVKTTYTYNDLDRVMAIVHTNAAGEVLAKVTYERSGVGEPTKITREDGSYVKLEYDEALRVTKESYYGATGTLLDETSYTYDAAGKRIAQSTGTGNRTYTYTPGYQLDTIQESSETENYEYDANGRLTLISRDGTTLDLEHDAYDRLTEVENVTTGEQIEYTYDGAGHRVKATKGTEQRRFLVAPAMGTGLESTIKITDGAGNLIANYIYAGGSSPLMRLDASGNPIYYLTDAMGSVIGLADGAGQSAAKFSYDSFGNLRTASGAAANAGAAGGDFRFQGQWLESESGLYHFRARDYDSRTGTFLSRDPVDIIETEPESFNPYQFAYNNPYIHSDPSGEFTITEVQASLSLQDALAAVRQYSVNEARQRLQSKAYEAVGNAALNTLQSYVPIPSSLKTVIDSAQNAGNYFEKWFQDSFCEFLPDTSQVFFQPGVTVDGQAYYSGFTCSVYGLPNNERDYQIQEASLAGAKLNASRPDFIVTPPGSYPRYAPKGNVKSPTGPYRSWLIGDFKLSTKTLYNDYVAGRNPKKLNQWRAIANYAAYNALGFAGFITLFGENNEGFYERKLIEKAVSQSGQYKRIGLIIVTIFPDAKSPFR
jgi:RHS repeat-associated protein